MPITTSWVRTSPVGTTDNPQNGATEIADSKKMVDERARNAGHLWEPDAAATATNAGRHACGAEATSGGVGAVANEFYIYAADGVTKVATFKAASHANPGLELQNAANMVMKARKLQATTDGVLVDAGGITVTAGGLTIVLGTAAVQALTAAGLITANAGFTLAAGTLTLPASSVTNTMLAGPIVELGSGQAAGPTSLTTSEADLLTVAKTLVAGSTVHVFGKLSLDSTAGSLQSATLRLYRDAVLLDEVVFSTLDATKLGINLVAFDTPGAGTFTYKIVGIRSASTTAVATNLRLLVQDFRK